MIENKILSENIHSLMKRENWNCVNPTGDWFIIELLSEDKASDAERG